MIEQPPSVEPSKPVADGKPNGNGSHDVIQEVQPRAGLPREGRPRRPHDMLAELRADNRTILANMREVHDPCGESNDVATTSLLENWIDETEGRIWFLFETGRTA